MFFNIKKSKYYGKYLNLVIFQNLTIDTIGEIYIHCRQKRMSEDDTFYFLVDLDRKLDEPLNN